MNKLTWTGSLKKRSCLFKFIPFFYFHFSTLFCLPFLRKLHRKNALNFWWSVYYTLFYTSSPFTLMMEKTLICNCALFLTLKNICQPNSPRLSNPTMRITPKSQQICWAWGDLTTTDRPIIIWNICLKIRFTNITTFLMRKIHNDVLDYNI